MIPSYALKEKRNCTRSYEIRNVVRYSKLRTAKHNVIHASSTRHI